MAGDITLTFDAKLGPFIQSALKAAQAVEKIEGGVKKLTNATSRAARNLEETGDTGKRGFAVMDKAASELQQRLLGMIGAGAVLAQFREGLAAIRQEAESAADAIDRQVDSAAQLAQVSTGASDTKLALLQAQMAALESGMSLDAANRFSFAARSFNVNPADALTIARTGLITQAGGPERFLESVGKYQAPAAFGINVGSAEQLIAGFLAAGGPSDIASDVIAQASIKALGQVKDVGGTPSELLALMSVLSPGYASPEEAATGIRMLATVLRKEGYTQGGVVGGLQQFFAERPTEATAAIGAEVRAQGAFTRISAALPTIQQREREVSAALYTGAPFRQALSAADIPELTLAQEVRRTEIAKQISDLSLGQDELELRGLKNAFELYSEDLERRGEGGLADTPFGRWAIRKVGDVKTGLFGARAGRDYYRNIVGTDEFSARSIQYDGTVGPALGSQEIIRGSLEVIKQHLETQTRQMDEQNNMVRKQTQREPRELAGPNSAGAFSPDHFEP